MRNRKTDCAEVCHRNESDALAYDFISSFGV